MGIDAPTPARIGTCRPKGRSHFSFGGERKVCKRKPAARRLREKALYCPFLKEGVRNVARSTVGLPTFTFVRARAHSFPLSKRARLCPSAAYRRSAPPQLAWGGLTPCRLGWIPFKWPQAHTPAPMGPDAPTPARIGTCRPKGRSHFSFGGERKVCKRKPAARRLQWRPAPLRTAAKPCATLVLGYALHGLRPFLALVGLRPPLVAGFVLR